MGLFTPPCGRPWPVPHPDWSGSALPDRCIHGICRAISGPPLVSSTKTLSGAESRKIKVIGLPTCPHRQKISLKALLWNNFSQAHAPKFKTLRIIGRHIESRPRAVHYQDKWKISVGGEYYDRKIEKSTCKRVSRDKLRFTSWFFLHQLRFDLCGGYGTILLFFWRDKSAPFVFLN